MTDEFSRIGEIRRRLQSVAASGLDLEIGIGDDAALLAPSSDAQVLSVDTAVEGVHFHRRYVSFKDVGYRSVAAALSDLAAMGAQPRAALLSLILPADFEDRCLHELVDGVAEAAAQYGLPVVGGNLSAGAELSITTTVLGAVPVTGTGRFAALRRSGARPADQIYVTGTLGDAALGIECLKKGVDAPGRAARFIERWRRPSARIAQGVQLRHIATAAVDVSDGLLQDLGHLCRASRVGASVEVDAIPLSPGFAELAAALGANPLELALAGGEDYELVFTAPEGADVRAIGTRIGLVVAEPCAVRLCDREGGRIEVEQTGFRHWRGDGTKTP